MHSEYILKPALVPWKKQELLLLPFKKIRASDLITYIRNNWEFGGPESRRPPSGLNPTSRWKPSWPIIAHPYYEFVNQRSKSPAGLELPPNL